MAGFKMVNIKHLTPTDTSVKEAPSSEAVNRLEAFTAKYGQHQAIVIANVDGKVGIVDGNRLLKQLKKTDVEKVLCFYAGEMTLTEYISCRILLNYHQQRLDYIGVAEMIGDIATNKHEINDVSTRTAIDVQDVARYKALLTFDWEAFNKQTETNQMEMFG